MADPPATISSRTPEGDPHRCPICLKSTAIEPSTSGDSCCPSCGSLLWWFRDRVVQRTGVPLEKIALASSLIADLGLDSLDIVELVMEMEEEFDVDVPDEVAERIVTIADAIRYIESRRSTLE